MRANRNAYNTVDGKPIERKPFWRPRYRRENNTEFGANVAVKWVTPLLRIPLVEGQNLGPENGYIPTGVPIFLNSYRPYRRYYLKIEEHDSVHLSYLQIHHSLITSPF
jgi:hypothetical protein